MKYLKWIPVVLVLVVIAYFVTNNSEPVSVYFAEGYKINNVPTGLLVIVLLALGALVTILIVSVLGFRFWFIEKRFERQESKHQELWNKLQELQNLKTLGNYSQANTLINSLIKKYDNNPFLHTELAEIQAKSDPKLAIRTLEKARLKFPNQVFILDQLAGLLVNINPSLALDTLLYAIAITPGKEQALNARNLAINLERYDDAIALHNQCLELGIEDRAKETLRELELKKLIKFSTDLEKDLNDFCKTHPKFALSFIELGNFNLSSGKLKEAYDNFFKAFQLEPSKKLAELCMRALYEQNTPDKFIAFSRVAQNTLKDSELAEILVKYHLKFGMYEEASKILGNIDPAIAALCLLEMNNIPGAKEKLKTII